MVTLKHIHEDWKYLEPDAMFTGSEEIFLMKYPCKISIITHTFAVVFSSDVTSITVNQLKNIIQHYVWHFSCWAVYSALGIDIDL